MRVIINCECGHRLAVETLRSGIQEATIVTPVCADCKERYFSQGQSDVTSDVLGQLATGELRRIARRRDEG